MVMMRVADIERLVEGGEPDRSGVEYRNAWQTVEARIARTADPAKAASLELLRRRLDEIGPPLKRAPMPAEEAFAMMVAANEARAVGRGKARLKTMMANARFQVACVSDMKPFLFEAALQMIEDGEACVQHVEYGQPRRGPKPAVPRPDARWVWIAPADGRPSRNIEWQSRRRQAEEVVI